MENFNVQHRVAHQHILRAAMDVKSMEVLEDAIDLLIKHAMQDVDEAIGGVENLSVETSKADLLSLMVNILTNLRSLSSLTEDKKLDLRKQQFELIEHYYPELEDKLYGLEINAATVDDPVLIEIVKITDDVAKQVLRDDV